MPVLDSPRAAHATQRKPSLFRRFSRCPNPQPPTNDAAHLRAIRPPSPPPKPPPINKTKTNTTTTTTPTPLSPALSKNDSVIDVPHCSSPHLQKDKIPRKTPKMTHTQRITMPSMVSENPSHEPQPRRNSTKTPHKPTRVPKTGIPTTPFPTTHTPHISKWHVPLAPHCLYLLYLGHMPHDLADKWFVYSEGPDPAGKLKVHFHRSLTGVKVAELFLVVQGEDGGRIVGVKWDGGGMRECEVKFFVGRVVGEVFGFELEGREMDVGTIRY